LQRLLELAPPKVAGSGRRGGRPGVPEPRARRVPTFEGGTIGLVIGQNKQLNGYEILSMYPRRRLRGVSGL